MLRAQEKMSESNVEHGDNEWAILSTSCTDHPTLAFTPTDVTRMSKSVGAEGNFVCEGETIAPLRKVASRMPLMHPRFYGSGNNNSTEHLVSLNTGSMANEVSVDTSQTISVTHEDLPDLSIMHNRQKYYSRLTHHTDERMRMPDHVLPSWLFYVIPTKTTQKQSSIVTIFAIWNTMMGTSLLSMPWGMSQAGFTLGVLLILSLAALTLYTAYRVLLSKDSLDFEVFEFSDVCKYYLGSVGEWVAIIFCLVAFLGGMMVYWVLMSNFLYTCGVFIHDKATGQVNGTFSDEVLCPSQHNGSHSYTLHSTYLGNSTSEKSFSPAWTLDRTVPLYLALIIFPLLNFKSPTVFTKFNCFGTLSVFFIFAFIITKAATWGWNFKYMLEPDPSGFQLPEFRTTFPALSGMLSLAFFLHSAVITILRNNEYPEHNVRDLSLGYILVAVTYLTVGVLFYGSFPLPKACISANLFENLSTSDVFATVARFFLLFQMLAVFPLLSYMFRVNALYALFNTAWPGRVHVVIVNISIVTLCVLIAMFYPHIGEIISSYEASSRLNRADEDNLWSVIVYKVDHVVYGLFLYTHRWYHPICAYLSGTIVRQYSGSLCGLVYVFCLPSLVHILMLKSQDKLSWFSATAHSLIIGVGLVNFILQFLISPSL